MILSPGKVPPWPPLMDAVVIISHLALTTSSSLSFYIYYAKYGSPGRAQSSLKNIFNRITAFHMSLVQVSRQNTEETETEMF